MAENSIQNGSPADHERKPTGQSGFWLWRTLQGIQSGVFRLEGRLGIQRYRVTAEGLAFICFIFLVGGAAWHSGTNLLYLIFAVLISIFCSHGLLVWGALRRISAERTMPRHIFAGKPAVVSLVIHNRRRILDGFAFRLIDYDSIGQPVGAAFVGHIPAKGSASAEYSVVYPRRGIYRLSAVEAITRFPFGLIERGFRQKHIDELLVYPRICEFSSLSGFAIDGFGELEVPQRGVGTELYGLREYVPGEHARHIHWRSSARSKRLMVMEYERDERRHVTIILWNEVSADKSTDARLMDNFEKAVELAASIAYFLLKSNYEVQLVTASGHTAKGYGFGHLYEILRALASLTLSADTTERLASEKPEGSALEIVFGSPPTERQGFGTKRTILDARHNHPGQQVQPFERTI
jgi:uncharacterized protein (DUF58 family)